MLHWVAGQWACGVPQLDGSGEPELMSLGTEPWGRSRSRYRRFGPVHDVDAAAVLVVPYTKVALVVEVTPQPWLPVASEAQLVARQSWSVNLPFMLGF